MCRKSYPVLTTSDARATLDQLHENVTRQFDRVLITRDGSDAHSVLISKVELDALEKALDILSGTAEAMAMREEVMRIAADAQARQRLAVSA